MSSGNRTLVINTQERALSVDINRLQAFKAEDSAEILRLLLNSYRPDDDLIGNEVYPGSVETPLRAEIMGGLMVKPQIGSFDLLVDPGALYALAPDGGADESNYKLVRDLGVVAPGTISIGANASGSIRIDVIECRINPTQSIVTDNRDIFNPTTNLFTAAAVTKETKSVLEYRVRQGTPGAGLPASVSGWLPLCVAYVPDAAASNDSCTFWDVRPLVSDRANSVSAVTQSDGVDAWRIVGTFDSERVAANPFGRYYAKVDGQWRGRRVGGRLRSGLHGAVTADYLDVADSANNEAALAPSSEVERYLYMMFPGGLPRWARYDAAPSARIPRAPKGIPIFSTTAPSGVTGAPSAPIALPGLGASSEGYCLGWVWRRVYGVGPFDYRWSTQLFGADGRQHVSDPPTGVGSAFLPVVIGSVNGLTMEYSITDGQLYPAHAKEVLLEVSVSYSAPVASRRVFPLVKFSDDNTATNAFMEIKNFGGCGVPVTSGTASNVVVSQWVPAYWRPYGGVVASPRMIVAQLRGDVGAETPTAGTITCRGWRL